MQVVLYNGRKMAVVVYMYVYWRSDHVVHNVAEAAHLRNYAWLHSGLLLLNKAFKNIPLKPFPKLFLGRYSGTWHMYGNYRKMGSFKKKVTLSVDEQ